MSRRMTVPFTKQTASMYANIKLQNHAYSFRYSLEQTASTTAPVHLREQALKYDCKSIQKPDSRRYP